MIDVNVCLPPWPFRRLPVQTAAELAQHLARRGIQEAWVGSCEGCFQRDMAGVNARLHAACQAAESARLIPWGTVNPLAPDWREDVRRCREQYQMPGLRVTPSCHGYTLEAPELAELFAAAQTAGLKIQLVVSWEDERTQHPVFRIPKLDLTPLPGLVARFPELRLMLLNAFRVLTLDAAKVLAEAGHVAFDLAWLEGVDRVAQLVSNVGEDRVMLGSYFPIFYLESALLKLQETTLPAAIQQKIHSDNARQW